MSDEPDFDFDFDQAAFTGAVERTAGSVRHFGEQMAIAHAKLQEQLTPDPGMIERVNAVATSQGFLQARAERHVSTPSAIAQQTDGPHEIVEWVAIVKTGRGELVEPVEIPDDVLPAASSWTCPRCGRATPIDADDCPRCEGSLTEYAWLSAFRALGVAV